MALNFLIESDDPAMPQSVATMLRQRGAHVYTFPSKATSLAKACGIQHFTSTSEVVKKARSKKQDRISTAIKFADAFIMQGHHLINILQTEQLHRIDLYFRKLKEDDSPFGGLRVMVIASSSKARSALVQASLSPDKNLQSVIDRINLIVA